MSMININIGNTYIESPEGEMRIKKNVNIIIICDTRQNVTNDLFFEFELWLCTFLFVKLNCNKFNHK